MLKKSTLRKLIALMMLICAIFVPISVLAQSSETETVVEEETPLAGSKKKTSYQGALIVMFALAAGSMVVYFGKGKEKPMSLAISNVEANGDGSYIITAVVNNGKGDEMSSSNLEVLEGTAIVLKELADNDVNSAGNRSQREMVMVINEDTSLKWTVKGKSITIDGKDLISKQR